MARSEYQDLPLDDEIDQLISDIAVLKTDIADLETTIATLKSDLETTIATLKSDLETTIATLQSDLETTIATLQSSLETTLSGLETDLNIIGNGNPATMYAYEQDYYNGVQNMIDDGGYDYQNLDTDTIDVTNLRFLMVKFKFKYEYTGGGSPSGSQIARILINDDLTKSYKIDDVDYGIFDVNSAFDEPAESAWQDVLYYISVADLTGSQTIKFQARRGGASIEIYGDEFYEYKQIVNG